MDGSKNTIFARLAVLIATAVFIISCHTVQPVHQTAVSQIQSTVQDSIDNNKSLDAPRKQRIPPSVNAALLPSLSRYVTPAKEQQPRFDVTANKVPAREFFMGLVSGTAENIVVSPSIDGTISLNLKNVTLRQAMDAVRDIYGYQYNRTSYGYEILPPSLESQIFHINYLDVQRTGKSYVQLTTGQVSNQVGTVTVGGTSIYTGTTAPAGAPGSGTPQGLGTISSIETKSEMRFWQDMEKTLSNIVGKDGGRSVTINAQTGVIAVRAYPAELRRVANYINSMQSSLNRQVILEAKILEVQLNDNYQAGIDWSILANPAQLDPNTGLPLNQAGMGQDGTKLFRDTDLKEFDGIFAIRIKGNFKTLISLLQTQGNIQVLSSPHISTVNNQKAVIKVGQDEFFVTGVSTTNTIVGTNTLPSQDVSLTPFFSGVTLDVTPEISNDNTVVLHIHPSVSKVKEQTKVIGLGTSGGNANNLTLPLAFSTIRESDNVVRAKSGQVVVIGGLMENAMDETVAETPWISKVPFLGSAFRRTKQQSRKIELVILLRPIIASNQNFINKLEEEKQTFEIVKRPFHQGGLSKIFGNEAEVEVR